MTVIISDRWIIFATYSVASVSVDRRHTVDRVISASQARGIIRIVRNAYVTGTLILAIRVLVFVSVVEIPQKGITATSTPNDYLKSRPIFFSLFTLCNFLDVSKVSTVILGSVSIYLVECALAPVPLKRVILMLKDVLWIREIRT